MSEREPTPEKQPQKKYDTCLSCEQKYEINPDNVPTSYAYEEQPDCNFLYCVCPHCDYRTILFLRNTSTDDVRARGISVNDKEKYADPDIFKHYLQATGVEIVKPVELTDRHEKIVKKFGEALQNIPDELFWDGINSDPGKPYPLRWK